MRYAAFPGTNLAGRWNHVFAPAEMVEARGRGLVPPPSKRVDDVRDWFYSEYPKDPGREWALFGPIVAINDPDVAFAFRMRWC
jgi:hypothetical protein